MADFDVPCKEHIRMTTTTTTVSDSALQENVLAEISFDPIIAANDIGVTCKNGVVTLRGTVTSYAQKLFVEQAAKRVCGVHAFTDELLIDLPMLHRRDDRDIAAAVIETLKWDVTVSETSVKAKVSDGWVTLEGEAEWQADIHNATRSIQYLTGVRGVTNLMTLTPKIASADILAKLEQVFKRSAGIDADHIQIEVEDARVTLRGTVHSWNEHDDATRAAYSLPGVKGVHNLTQVT